MTTTKNNETKKPDFHIFLEAPEGNRYAGTIYCHKKGNGMGIVIGGMLYVAFPPKSKPAKGRARKRSLTPLTFMPNCVKWVIFYMS
jgi:hypothetical protein